MGYRPRYQPKYLARKLRQIRESLGLSQSELARRLSVGVNTPRLSEYESGTREPALITLLAYGYLVGIPVDHLIDDSVQLPARIRIKQKRKQIVLPD
jgi:transcriptional regulator with XRE-family HTH domain